MQSKSIIYVITKRLPERPTSSDDVKVNINMKKDDEDKEDK